MKTIIFLFFCLVSVGAKAQKIDSIYLNLYTDSLKKGTYNYINVDGLMSNGTYRPLDSTQLFFKSSYGKFYGNDLWIDTTDFHEPINIVIMLRSDSSVQKKTTMYIKKATDGKLKTADELLSEMRQEPKKRKSR